MPALISRCQPSLRATPEAVIPALPRSVRSSTAEWQQADLDSALAHAKEGQLLALQVGDRYGLGHVLADQGNIARQQGQSEAAAALLEESLSHFRALGHSRGTWRALSNLGATMIVLGDHQRARQLLEESLSTAHAIGYAWGIGSEHRRLGLLAFSEGDLDRAEASFSEALAIVAASWSDERSALEHCTSLGAVLLLRGEHARAMVSYRESLMLSQELGDSLGILEAVEGVAAVGVGDEQRRVDAAGERAARLLGAAAAQREVRGTPLRPTDRPIVEQAQAAARAQLGDAAYERALAEGHELSLDQAAALALELAREMQAAASEPDGDESTLEALTTGSPARIR